jgi:tetratricopeptide (TPR) repeat protein
MSGGIMSRQVGVTPDAAFQQAVALQQRGDLAGAEKIYRAILKQQPKHLQTLSNLAAVLLLGERMTEAIPLLRKALNQNPNSAVVHTHLARAFALLDRHEEALERANRAIALDPQLPGAHATLAQVLSNLGRYAEAKKALTRAIELAPEHASFYYYMGQIARWTADDPCFAALEALVKNAAALPLPEQVAAHFALAKAYDDCGDIERSFRHQIEGGTLQRRFLKYNETATLGELDEVCSALDADWLTRHRGGGDPSSLPVFVLGMPRSGSTLIEQILASHPRVHALGERLTFIEALAQVCGTSTVPASLGYRASRWSDAELRKLGGLYREATQRETPASATRAVDKLPTNFQYVGLIHAALPNARIIHTQRDAVDTCLSVFSILFSGGAQLYSYDLAELGRYHRAYEKVMAHWRNILPAGVMLGVDYEEVVHDLEGQARRIVAHCGLEWDDACLEFHKADRAVRTVSHAQVRQPIYRTSVGRPRPPRDLLLPLLETLGIA